MVGQPFGTRHSYDLLNDLALPYNLFGRQAETLYLIDIVNEDFSFSKQ
jgi:hypothetical protein